MFSYKYSLAFEGRFGAVASHFLSILSGFEEIEFVLLCVCVCMCLYIDAFISIRQNVAPQQYGCCVVL